ncbi:hypothetical protein CPC735_061770 [Coccidioides posadasii C735 delta SOWgp]|uniref:Chromosome segregation in meiosis protein n=2 Tax=Coccidioides posadasii TaxID=199306 RepID=A0A0J6FHD6_COCPO|nr:hypothetical protein CPC735_061770 [Coccidioides posadasii C735 delta SOWgp]EER28304.1 hypothetical protein CPC735_061770 [Coccidioides posadasii C735 delta SOWgp]KMM68775.1 hypothetical protein CPAG_05099 [Coccidioides posadasii RMSCC 3488]|eukprot:XP_003070449.1 hypothetical protein CPC735_061770 [Coccidioides posadasii C735 delta SOWgp]
MAEDTAFDDLFNYDAGIEDLLRDPEEEKNDGRASGTGTGSTENKNDDLVGLEEIKITRKRAPPVKLDENRLLSQAGIPKLRKSAKTKLKFKGKRHEFSDVARLLNFYQLWLDDLYPRAKFADGLSIIEKLGHTKRMQVMRKEWIDEGKPGRNLYDSNATSLDPNSDNRGDKDTADPTIPSIFQRTLEQSAPAMEAHRNDQAESTHSPKRLSDSEIPSIFGGGKAISLRNNADDDDDLFVPGNEGMDIDPPVQASQVPEEDDLDTFLAEQESTMQNTAHGLGILKPNAPPADEEDDLDALLAEAENTPARAPKTGHLEVNRPAADDFDDELHMLNEFGL